MTEVVSIRFKRKGKVYFFSPNGLEITSGTPVIVETAKGCEYAECTAGNHMVEDDAVTKPLRPVIRLATEADIKKAQEHMEREKTAFRICSEKIAKHGLDMKLVDVEYSFDGSKLLFFFTSEGRVDFRDLVKDLASEFKTRIELRQIGVRDEARLLGGLGICGRPFCCAQFLDDFQPVSIKMAKTQGLSLNPTKISGTCGRLMCCLKYEQEAYESLVKTVPKVDSFVNTPKGRGMVIDVNLLRGYVRVKLEDPHETNICTFPGNEVLVLGGKAKRAEYLAAKAAGEKVDEAPYIPPKSEHEGCGGGCGGKCEGCGGKCAPSAPSSPAPAPEKQESRERRPNKKKRQPPKKPGTQQQAQKQEGTPAQGKPAPSSGDKPKPKNNRPRNRRKKPSDPSAQQNKPQTPNGAQQTSPAPAAEQQRPAGQGKSGGKRRYNNYRKKDGAKNQNKEGPAQG